MNNKILPLALAISLASLSGCDGDDGQNGTDGINGFNALVSLTPLAAGDVNCTFGGKQIETGLDRNLNGLLDADEVDTTQTQYVCQASQGKLNTGLIGRYESGIFGASAAEIVAYHRASNHSYVVNAQSGTIDGISLAGLADTPATASTGYTLNNLTKSWSLDIAADTGLTGLGSANSVAIHGDLMAIAIERQDEAGNSKQGAGIVAFYQLSLTNAPSYLKAVSVGALPDALTFNHAGTQVLVANEGEPTDDYLVDPEGSISLIQIHESVPADAATHIGFSDFNVGGNRADEISAMIKLNGPGASVAQDLEPEYISVSANDQYAYVSLQENNAIAVIDLMESRIESLIALGLKDYGQANNAIDASDKDDAINIMAYEGVYGMYQPDTIASYAWNESNFIVTANEGDARDYAGFSEEERADDLTLDPNHPQFAAAQDKTQLGRLKVTTSMGDTDMDGDMDKVVSYGARSFSIWSQDGQQVYDSGSDFERITAAILGDNFNNHNEESKGDARSDDKGPEPEALALGKIADKMYAFIGLERTSGFMIYDITNPFDVSFVDYIVNRNFDIEFEIDGDTLDGQPELAGDLGPEGMRFVAATDSPTGLPLLIVSNEVSGSTSVYQIQLQ